MNKHTCRLRPATVAAIVITFTASMAGQVETVIHSFAGGNDGASPQSGLILDGKGNLYGTTEFGGTNGSGTVFELSPGSNGTWTETILYNFGSSATFADGIQPWGPVIFDGKGNLYGTTSQGGTAHIPAGTVFELSPSSGGTWNEKVIYSFTGGADGNFPTGGLSIDTSGNLYGTTFFGGNFGFGTVFEVVAGLGGTWSEKVLHHFSGGNDGAFANASTPILDSNGNVYGIALQGGPHDYGLVFELVRASNWAEKVLYAFPGGAGGSFPLGSLVFDSAGNVYGEATYTVFKLSPTSTGPWLEKTLHSFVGGSDGASPDGGLVFDKSGNLYGTSNTGGAHHGTVYKLMPTTTGPWATKILHRFTTTGGDGLFPLNVTPAVDSAGHVFGTTSQGGTSSLGAVFEITQ